MYAFLREELDRGHQAYIVCPLVEPSEAESAQQALYSSELRSAKEVWAELSAHQLSGYHLGLIWGQQKTSEKETILKDFREGSCHALVATTVIEVGVDNPNASVMVVENAHQFGLSQLHQLRGRVGRGSLDSWCFLLSDKGEKLRILRDTNDGFQVSQKDLELRGPGDLIGVRQSGESTDSMILNGDVRMLDETNQSVRHLMESPEGKQILNQLILEYEHLFGNRTIGVH